MTLIGYWPLNDSSGATSAIDVAGSNNATINGATLGEPGIIGGTSCLFDSASEYVLPSGGTPSNNTWSLSAWVLFDDGSSTQRPVSIGGALDIQAFSGSIDVLTFDATQEEVTVLSSYSTNTWYHIAATVSDTTLTGYLNGEEIDSISAGPPSPLSNNVRFGERHDGNIYEFFGRLSEVRLYNHILSPSEVQYLYEVSRSGTVRFSSKTDS